MTCFWTVWVSPTSDYWPPNPNPIWMKRQEAEMLLVASITALWIRPILMVASINYYLKYSCLATKSDVVPAAESGKLAKTCISAPGSAVCQQKLHLQIIVFTIHFQWAIWLREMGHNLVVLLQSKIGANRGRHSGAGCHSAAHTSTIKWKVAKTRRNLA